MAGFLVPLGILLLMIALGKPLMEAGFYASMAALAIYFVMNYREHGLKKLFRDMIKALSGGGLDIVRLVPILVSMSVLVNLIGLAGLAPKISSVIFDVGLDLLQRVPTLEPLRGTKAHVCRLLDQCTSAVELVDALSGG